MGVKIADKTREELELFHLVFDSFINGAIITDADGIVTHLNQPYGEFLGIKTKDFIGKHCTDVVENTRMHIVAKSGVAEINQTQKIKGKNIIVHRIPIKRNNKVFAVFGLVMFQNINEVSKLAEITSVLESKVQLYEQELRLFRSTRYSINSIIGESRQIKRLKDEALRAASNNFPVLVTGESGTGKELFAQSIHHESLRNIYPFVRINCAAIPNNLLESELFGYDKGAFTGANNRGKPGKFELANKGTIFLDEVGDLPLEMQPKLLRVLEEKEFEHVGGTKVLTSDFRLVSATNQNLEEMMSNKHFRKDLYYRMNVIHLHIPPLRERKSDILPLANHLLKQLSEEIFSFQIGLDKETENALLNHSWPGNVRELSNVLERTLCSLQGNMIRLQDLPYKFHQSDNHKPVLNSFLLKNVVADAEKKAIKYALKESGNNKAKAAEMLGIHRTLLYKRMNRYKMPLDKG